MWLIIHGFQWFSSGMIQTIFYAIVAIVYKDNYFKKFYEFFDSSQGIGLNVRSELVQFIIP